MDQVVIFFYIFIENEIFILIFNQRGVHSKASCAQIRREITFNSVKLYTVIWPTTSYIAHVRIFRLVLAGLVNREFVCAVWIDNSVESR